MASVGLRGGDQRRHFYFLMRFLCYTLQGAFALLRYPVVEILAGRGWSEVTLRVKGGRLKGKGEKNNKPTAPEDEEVEHSRTLREGS